MEFLLRWYGYSLTGSTKEQALLFKFGDGGNGKGVLMTTVFGIMGDYAKNAAMDTFLASARNKHPTDLAMLAGARLVLSTEVDANQEWDEARVKTLTGGDPITAHFMRQDFFTYMPTFKLVISGNHRPALRRVDAAARRRFLLAPFMQRPATPDKDLTEKLREEWPGILRLLIDRCLEWQRGGLQPPEIVKFTTTEYFETQDSIGLWIEERCERGRTRSARPSELLNDYNAWADRAGERTMCRKAFRDEMEVAKDFRFKKVRGDLFVDGIALKSWAGPLET